MTQVTAKITGVGNIQQSLNTIGRAAPRITSRRIGEAMTRAMKRAVPWDGGASYAVPTSGDYQRTGTLGRETNVVQNGEAYTIQSNAYQHGHAYSKYVIGDASGAGQASIHAGRWVLLAQAVEDELIPLTDEIDGDLSDLARQEGIGL